VRKGFKSEYLVKTGLCYETDDHRLRDRFWGRVIFPVHTLSGKVVAFGGRVLSSQTKGVKVKYVNSPESVIYHKSNELYGIYFAKQAIVKQDRCFLVEGYTDVISMHQSGVENVVASSGTALTSQQIRLIHRFTNNITVLYDGDKAGIKASIRGIDMLLEEGMNIKVCLLPDDDDPDSFARKHNSTEFQQFIADNETDFIRFKTNLLMEDAGKDPIKRAGLISDIVQSIAVIPEAIVRDVYIKECCQLLQLEDKLLVSEVAKRREINAEKARKGQSVSGQATQNVAKEGGQSSAEQGQTPTDVPPFPPEEETYHSFIPQENREGEEFYRYERMIIQAVVRYGEKVMCYVDGENGEEAPLSVIRYVVHDLEEDDLSFHNPVHRRIMAEAASHDGTEGFVAQRFFISHPDPEISRVATELASDRYQLSKYHTKAQKVLSDEERLVEIVPMLMIDFKNAIVASELKHIMNELRNPAVAGDAEKCDALMARFSELKQVESMMAKRLGDRVVLPQ
jgi:DNA primase